MKILIVDLDTEWRGGQNQALLMLEGFNARHHVAELVTPEKSALGERAAARGITVHTVSSRTARVSAALKIFELLKPSRRNAESASAHQNFDLVHANANAAA